MSKISFIDKYYVSIEGDDSWSGEIEVSNSKKTDGPFRTIEKAKSVIRNRDEDEMSGDIAVYLRGGCYYLDSTLSFDEMDSGTDGFKIKYMNYPGEKPVISGGKRITNWELYSDNVYRAYIGTDNCFNSLYENGSFCNKARFPVGEYNRVESISAHEPKNSFYFKDTDIPRIANKEFLQVYVWSGGPFGDWNWFANIIDVKEIDYDKRLMKLKDNTPYEMGEGSRYFIQGSMELLKVPGQFYFDKRRGYVYYIPKSLPVEHQEIVISSLSKIVEIKGSSEGAPAQNISFEGITIRNSDTHDNIISVDTDKLTAEDGAVHIENARYISIKNCLIHNTGWHGILLQFSCSDNELTGNHIYDIGHTGIQIQAPINSIICRNRKNNISNNHIHNTGKIVGHGAGIQIVESSDNIIVHNRIHHTPRYSISLKALPLELKIGQIIDGLKVSIDNHLSFKNCRNNRVEYNDVSHGNMDSQDTGLIESWGGGYKNIISNNYLHDSSIPFSFGVGLYLDDQCDYFTVENNLICRLQRNEEGGKLIYAIYVKGIGNKISNNIIADNGVFRSAIGSFQGNPEEFVGGFEIGGNILYNSSNLHYYQNWGQDRLAFQDYNMVYNNEKRFGVSVEKGLITDGNNLNIVDYTWDDIDMSDWINKFCGKYDRHSLVEDPRFIDSAKGDYRLRYDSPAYKLGIKDIEYSKMGLKEDFYFSDQSEDIDRVFASVEKLGDRSWAVLKSGDSMKLMVKARTVTGFIADLNEYLITFEADDKSIANVDANGLVTALGYGVCTLNITVKKNGKRRNTVFHVVVVK